MPISSLPSLALPALLPASLPARPLAAAMLSRHSAAALLLGLLAVAACAPATAASARLPHGRALKGDSRSISFHVSGVMHACSRQVSPRGWRQPWGQLARRLYPAPATAARPLHTPPPCNGSLMPTPACCTRGAAPATARWRRPLRRPSPPAPATCRAATQWGAAKRRHVLACHQSEAVPSSTPLSSTPNPSRPAGVEGDLILNVKGAPADKGCTITLHFSEWAARLLRFWHAGSQLAAYRIGCTGLRI